MQMDPCGTLTLSNLDRDRDTWAGRLDTRPNDAAENPRLGCQGRAATPGRHLPANQRRGSTWSAG